MYELFLQYLLFLAKSATVVVALLFVVSGMASAIRHAKEQLSEQLEVKNLNQRFENMADALYGHLLTDAQAKERAKKLKAEAKADAKAEKLGKDVKKGKLFALDFDGDIRASAVDNLREEITAVLQVAEAGDEIVVRLESGGGMVHSYGLAASQLRRIRDHGVTLTVCVDRVAASGGYMMACVADKLLAAPFSIIGSIGVVAQVPNFNRLLKEHNVDFEMHTAGEFKRTLTLFGENTDEAREKFKEDLEETHELFKTFITEQRPALDIEQVATGEHWLGTRALELGLIDQIQTSDDYLLESSKEKDLFSVEYKQRKPLSERLGNGMARLVNAVTFSRKAQVTH